MRITATRLHDHPVVIEPSPVNRPWPGAGDALLDDPSLQAATSRGWDLLCPYGFEAVWDGGSEPEAIQISAPGFVESRIGHGILSFQTGYEFALDPGHHLWVRGPANQFKDGIQPLDQVIESDLLPYVGDVHWRFTRPNEPVSFERGEPFGTLLPYPAGYIEQFHGEIQEAREPALPGVSCVCATYGRPHLLEETIYSFLMQDYRGPKELVILNDFADHQLEYDHPEVRIFNVPRRFRSLGEKMNAAIALCSHDLLFVWDDDDIYLPHRISLSVERFAPEKGMFKARKAFYLNNGQITGLEANVFHAGSCWSRALYESVAGYPYTNSGLDQGIEQRFQQARLDSVVPADLAPDETYYLYRWAGTGSYHLSGLAGGSMSPDAGYEPVAAWVAAEAAQGRIPLGRVQLQPQWRDDYAGLVRGFLESLPPQPLAAAAPTAHEQQESLPIAFSRLPRPVSKKQAATLFRGDSACKISVVLPVCNEAGFLQRTFDQFSATLPAPSEIIVVDNGSTDGSADFLAEGGEGMISADGISIRLIQTAEPLGVAGARNRGLQDATGEVIIFADAHVDVPPGWWPPLVSVLNQPGVGLVGPAFGVMGNSDSGATMYGQQVLDARLRTRWLPKRQDNPYPVPVLGGGFMALRRDVLTQVGGFDAGMQQWGSEDLELSLRLWLLGYEVWIVPDVEVPHYFRTQNPYQVEWKYVLTNQLRTLLLHLSPERLARGLHGLLQDKEFPRALALCADSDVWRRREELLASRVHDDDWFFNHPYFRDIEMER